MSTSAIAVIGLSNAGKSTWLGALCDVMERTNDAGGSLRMDGLPDIFQELLFLRNALNSGRYPDHTPPAHNAQLTFPLVWQDRDREERFALDVSDYSGERVARLYERHGHSWDAGWEERASRTRVALLLRADAVRRLVRRRSTDDHRPLGMAQLISAEHQPDEVQAERHPPTALALIEALQAMRMRRGIGMGRRPERGAERIAVLLTAWDKITGDTKTLGPEAFLSSNAPLLAAWLRANIHPEDCRVYGLSATGGDLAEEKHAQSVRKRGIASMGYVERGSPSIRDMDVSRPIEWLLFGRDSLVP